MLPDAEPTEASHPFARLSPDAVLNALDAIGLRTSGQLLALNSFENRVFQIGVDDDAMLDDVGTGAARSGVRFVIAKFYRPERWSDGQILEEHALTAALAAAEVPAVPPLEIGGATLHDGAGFRFAVFARRGGRAPNLDDVPTLRQLGRLLGRLHVVGAAQPFALRPALTIETFGRQPVRTILAHPSLQDPLREVYRGVATQALDEVGVALARAGTVSNLRLHGDCHEGNVLWTDAGGHLVDFDDARTGPAVQDLWMLLGSSDVAAERLRALLEGYEAMREFDRRELLLIEALRTLRLIHYAAWIAQRWDDPAFPAAFPWFGTDRYWQDRILELREQIAAMQEPALTA